MWCITELRAEVLDSHKLVVSEQVTQINRDWGREGKRVCSEVNFLLQVS